MPLRWKLVTWYGAILALVFGGSAVLLPVGLRHMLVAAVDDELAARARTIGAVTELEHGEWIVEGKSGVAEDFAPALGLYFVVADGGAAAAEQQGQVLARSPLAQALGLGALADADAGAVEGASADAGAGAGTAHVRRAGGRRFRELTLAVTKSAEEDEAALRGKRLLVTCGKDVAEVEFAVASLQRELWLLGPLVLVVALAGGLWLAGRALGPIDRMARTAAVIGESETSRRLEVRGRDELSRLGRTLNGTFDRLQETIEQQRRFTADASHELRTPLAAVLGHAELALRKPRTADEYRAALADIEAAGQRMRAIVDGLLLLARADAGGVPLARERVGLRELCAEVLRLHAPLAAAHDVELRLAGKELSAEELSGQELAVEPVAVDGDRARLQDLVGNLLGNAVRYNQPGGQVEVRVARRGDMTSIDVADTGIGIAAEHLPHLFDRFYRVDAARSRQAGGAGLGLAIAQWVAAAHGGRIDVASEPGRGSRFTVVLPAAPHARRSAEATVEDHVPQ